MNSTKLLPLSVNKSGNSFKTHQIFQRLSCILGVYRQVHYLKRELAAMKIHVGLARICETAVRGIQLHSKSQLYFRSIVLIARWA